MKIPVVQKIMNANDQIAAENRARFDETNTLVINVMASPGAGKTSLIMATASHLPDLRIGVIEGDVASTIDADRIAEAGMPVVQINTGGGCHLDAPMVKSALDELPLDDIDVLIIENVGNLICPAGFDLGAHLAVVLGNIPEGDDKPYKYPGMFTDADAIILHKVDMLPHFDFDVEYFRAGVQKLHPDIPLFLVSSRTGEGIAEWGEWLLERRRELRTA